MMMNVTPGLDRYAARCANSVRAVPCRADHGAVEIGVRTAIPSIARRVNGERLVLLGWGRAILLQLAHPLVAAGVFDHSGFRASAAASALRLRHTVQAMLELTFGDEGEQERALNGLRAIHRRVHGVLRDPVGPFPAGTSYSAEDPALVVWVHATLVESMITTYEWLVAPLTEAERDAYCVDAGHLAVALGAREADVPSTWGQTRAYIDRMVASNAIVVGPQARELARAVLRPRGAWLGAPLAWINRTVTAGLLPAPIRDEYGMRWTMRHHRRWHAVGAVLRFVRRTLPDRLALWKSARR
jgi:uncharacterized protein (DUF2236 family)